VAVIPWPNPIPGQPDQVIIDGMPMQVVPGKYSVEEADRFGEKVSSGALSYSDFNPYENAWAISALVGGAGLRRYSDAGDDVDKYITLYTESTNVNCAFAPIVLSPQVLLNTLPGATAPAVWMGEDWRSNVAGEAKRLLAVASKGADTGVYVRTSGGPWTLWATITAKTDPVPTAIGIYEGTLVVGYASRHLAASVSAAGVVGTVTQDASEPAGVQPLYVWAFTSDHASAFVAGGPSVTDYYRVMSSVDPHQLYSKPVATGDSMVASLAPGGGLVSVYVGKISELGCITLSAVYQSLIPFDSRLDTNCKPMKWLLASGADQQRGSLTLVFPRDRSLWEYAPADQFSGTASCIAPWAQNFRRPPNARGKVTALIGSSRWLYYAVQNSAGNTWIWRNDQSTGSPHTYLYLGAVTVSAMAVTHLFSGNPLLLFSIGTQIGSVILPLDGDAEFDDPSTRYALQGYLDLPDVDLGFPDEDKIGFGVRIIADNLAGLNRYIRVEASIDGGAWVDMGIANQSPSDELDFPINNIPRAKRLKLRVWLYTDDATVSPQLWGISLRVSLNTKVYRLFVLQTRVPAGSFSTLADDLQNPYLQILHSWVIRRAGFPVSFADPWNDPYWVRVLKVQQQQALREPDRTPEWVIDWTLLEFLAGDVETGEFRYDMDWTTDPPSHPEEQDLYGYDQPLATYAGDQSF